MILRERFTRPEADNITRQEQARLLAAGAPDGGWDFYFLQLDMYAQYAQKSLFPDVPDLPTPQFGLNTENYLQQRQELKAAYDKTALTLRAQEIDENLGFYDRLALREDRRRAYYEWLASEQHEIDDWAMIWARQMNGARWDATDQPTRLDDWYYGVNFASGEAKVVRINQQEYVLSTEPQHNLRPRQMNVLSTNLTPYDIIDHNGEMKRPEVEAARGTLVEPAEPSGSEATNRIEMRTETNEAFK